MSSDYKRCEQCGWPIPNMVFFKFHVGDIASFKVPTRLTLIIECPICRLKYVNEQALDTMVMGTDNEPDYSLS